MCVYVCEYVCVYVQKNISHIINTTKTKTLGFRTHFRVLSFMSIVFNHSLSVIYKYFGSNVGTLLKCSYETAPLFVLSYP